VAAPGKPPTCVVEIGEPAPAILARLRSGGFDYGALTTHGRRGVNRLLLGSVAETVVRSSATPLIINRPDASAGDWKTIVVALDGSPAAEGILDVATRLARTLGSTLRLINIGDVLLKAPTLEYSTVHVPDMKPYLEGVRARLTAAGLAVETETLIGSPGPDIVRRATETGAGLIAVTTLGRTGLPRAIMGSVAEHILRTAPCPVLVKAVPGK
jgi:nucleotide-binding universal stress UspA family protein